MASSAFIGPLDSASSECAYVQLNDFPHAGDFRNSRSVSMTPQGPRVLRMPVDVRRPRPIIETVDDVDLGALTRDFDRNNSWVQARKATAHAPLLRVGKQTALDKLECIAVGVLRE